MSRGAFSMAVTAILMQFVIVGSMSVADAQQMQAKNKKPFCGMSCCLKRNADATDRGKYRWCYSVTGGRETR